MSVVATSIGLPRASVSSLRRAARSSSVRPGSRSTSRSTSLSDLASPRAVEPNTLTFRAPCLRAIASSSPRRRRKAERLSCDKPSAACAERIRRSPHVASSRSSVATEGTAAPVSYRATADCEVPAIAATSACERPAVSRAFRSMAPMFMMAILYLIRYRSSESRTTGELTAYGMEAAAAFHAERQRSRPRKKHFAVRSEVAPDAAGAGRSLRAECDPDARATRTIVRVRERTDGGPSHRRRRSRPAVGRAPTSIPMPLFSASRHRSA